MATREKPIVTVREAEKVGVQDLVRNAVVVEHKLVTFPKEFSVNVVYTMGLPFQMAKFNELLAPDENFGFKLGPVFESDGSHKVDLLDLYIYRRGHASKGEQFLGNSPKIDMITAKILSNFGDVQLIVDEASSLIHTLINAERTFPIEPRD